MPEEIETPWIKIVSEMSDETYMAYAGVYQSYAWQQGEQNRIMEFRLPDEYFLKDRTNQLKGGFVLSEFMAVVADMDNEGFIHYWRLRTVTLPKSPSLSGSDWVERYLSLGCTEDDSMRDEPNLDRRYLHASDKAWYI